jgi:hypothetical protein
MFQHAQRICVFALATFGLYAQTNVTPPVQVTRTTGIVGIAEGQTARLNALNPGIAPAGQQAPPAPRCSRSWPTMERC